MTDRAKYIDLANTVRNHPLVQANPQGQAAAELISAGARHVGFARIAAGMARWAAEPGGIEQLQARLADEQFDTMYLAPISYAASAALTCLDVCAAAAYRLFVGDPGTGWESDLRKLTDPRKPVLLPPNLAQWATDTVSDPAYQDLLLVRKRMVHRDMPSASIISSVPTTTYPVNGKYVAPQDATQLFAQIAEHRYPTFIGAVLAELE